MTRTRLPGERVPRTDDDGQPAGGTYAIRLEPVGVVLGCTAGETVLEAAGRAGWTLPSSCRNGSCRACLCRLSAGAIGYGIEWPGLSAQERADGWMLPCVAVPVTDIVVTQPDAAPAVAANRRTRGF